MMNAMANCGGWLILAAGIVTYGTLLLAGAASVKYLFFEHTSSKAGAQ